MSTAKIRSAELWKGGKALIDGAKIKRLRNERDMTLEEASNRVGVAMTYFQQFEREVRTPRVDTLKRIAELFGVTTDELYKEG